MSRETLRLLAPHLRSCLMEMLTTHEDVELGRCGKSLNFFFEVEHMKFEFFFVMISIFSYRFFHDTAELNLHISLFCVVAMEECSTVGL